MNEDTQAVETTTQDAPAPAPVETAAAPVKSEPSHPVSIREALGRAAKEGAPPAAKEAPAKVQEKNAAGPARDLSGRFAAPQESAAKVQVEQPLKAPEAAQEQPPEPQKADAAPAAESKAPQAWRPAVRELAAKLPPEFRPILEESNRREKETSIALQQAAEGRKFGDAVRQAIQPFESVFAANNVDPVTGINQLARTAYVLNTGGPQQRAQAIAGMVRNFLGTDEAAIGLLAQAIDGGGVAPAPRQPAQIDPRAIAAQVRQEIMNEAQGHLVQQKVAEVEKFAESHPFLDDLREDMAALATAYGQRGRKLTLEQAYTMAVNANPEISAIVKQREAATAAPTAQAATARTEAAASSVRSQPAGVRTNTGKTLSPADALRQAAADVSGRSRV